MSGIDRLKRMAVVVLVGMFVTAPLTWAYTNDNRLCWTPNTESDLAGYRIYVVTVSGPTSAAVATVTVPRAQAVSGPTGHPHACPTNKVGISVGTLGLPDASTYFVTVSAFDTATPPNESARSLEVSLSPLDNPPAVVVGVEVR